MAIMCLTIPVTWEEQSYSMCSGPGWALHSEIVAPYLLNYGTEEQKQKCAASAPHCYELRAY